MGKVFKNQVELFNWIWDNRPHISELSGKPLLPRTNYQWIWQFLHLLPKGTYPKWKLESKNIVLALPDEHERQNEFEEFNKRYEENRREYYKEFYGKEF